MLGLLIVDDIEIPDPVVAARTGFNFFTEELGKDWVHRVDLETLYMGSMHVCVAAQVFGSWYNFREIYSHINCQGLVNAGLDFFGGDNVEETQEEWVRLILEARG